MMRNLKEKLIEFVEASGHKKSDIENLTGIARTILTGESSMKQKLSEPTIMKIIKAFPNLNLDWWFRDEGPMYRDDKSSGHYDLMRKNEIIELQRELIAKFKENEAKYGIDSSKN